jgi:NAD(P)-dependent dehydrogenase (short-subunit alcohol dehydrogenase family)
MLLQGKTALITGASKGIGRAIALAFANEGADLAVTARAGNELESLRDEVLPLGSKCEVITADLADHGATLAVYERARQALGSIDVMVNNAGIGSSADPKPVVDYDDDFWNLLLYVNLTVPYLLCKLVLPEMIERKRGRIINVASINGKIGSVHGAAYAASKHGLLGLTRTLAMEVVKEGITVNAICPGPVHTLLNDIRIAYDAERLGITLEEIEQRITPMGRRLEPIEVAPLAVYLASDQAAAMTGQALNIDGGVLMTG